MTSLQHILCSHANRGHQRGLIAIKISCAAPGHGIFSWLVSLPIRSMLNLNHAGDGPAQRHQAPHLGGTWAGNAGSVETTPPMRLLKKLSPGSRIAASMNTMLAMRLGICCSSICIHTPASEWPTKTTFCRLFTSITYAPSHIWLEDILLQSVKVPLRSGPERSASN